MASASAQSVRVERLTYRLREDFLGFFDRLRASDPGCEAANCYCHYFHVATAIPWNSLDAAANRVAMAARTEVGEMDGFLAYIGQRVVGWLSAQPYQKLSHLWSRLAVPELPRGVPPHEAAALVCFVLDRSCQQHNVDQALLEGALTSFRERGIRSVDAFPRPDDETAAHPDHGRLSLYLGAGFLVQREERRLTIVRKIL